MQVFDVPADVARQCVPAEFDIVTSKDGFTEGSLYIANYNNQSTLEYNELIFICAQVQYQGNQGGWIHSIYVDNDKAQEAGINVWGLPKKMATFSYDRNTDPNMQHIVVKDKSSGTLVVDASFEDKAMKIPFMHQTVASFGVDQRDPNVLYHSETKQKYGVKVLKEAILNIPSTSPLYSVTNASVAKTKVEMANGLFNMTAPTSIPIKPSRARGYFRTTPEVGRNTLKIQGSIPKWLNGALIRNSPGKYENGDDQVRHWNDGWAQVHRWEINGDSGSVVHLSKFLNTSSYHKAETLDHFAEPGYGTPKDPGPRPRVPIKPGLSKDGQESVAAGPVPKWQEKFASNPMVNIWKFDNKYVATTDENLFLQFDPVTLETIGSANTAWSNDEIEKIGLLGLGVAHGRYDRYAKEHFWLELGWNDGINGGAHYNVWQYNETGFNGTGPLPPRRIVGTVKDKMTSFVHSFGLTKKYILIIQCPMHYHFLDFFTAKKVIDAITWDDTFPVKFHILDRQTGKWLRTVESTEGAWFVYHILNAFDDEDGNIVVDFSKYHNDTLITYGMYFENLIDRPKEFVPCFGQSRLTRCTIPVASGNPTCTEVLDETFEMATFNWVNYHMQPHRFTWGTNFVDANTDWHEGTSDFIDQIVKIDVEQGVVAAKWNEENVYVCEPLFVPNPNPKGEDDGAIVFVGYNSAKDHSTLYVLDGQSMKELGRADMPGRFAANFHGKFCPFDQDYCIGL